MFPQYSGLSPFHWHRYSLRTYNDSTVAGGVLSDEIWSDEVTAKITDFFNVRKRRSVSPAGASVTADLKKRNKKGIMLDINQEDNLQSHFSRCSRVTVLNDLPANPFGVFAAFSPETVLVVIDRIPVALLANLALTSRNFNCSLRRYAVSGSAQKRFAKETGVGTVPALTNMTPEDPFYAWGKFLKSITITEGVFDRIEYFNIFYAKFAEQWDFDECARLMRSLLATTENGLYRTMCEVLGGEGGQHPVSEMKVRRGLRELFLEHQYSDARDLSFWLSAILRTQFQVCCQARLMYVLFGPTKINDVSEEVIDWRGPCEVPISTYHNSKQRLGPLSDAFLRLLQTKYIGVSEFAYAEADVFNLLEEITTYPEPWSFDNFAALLLNRPGLIPVALVFRVVCGYHEEAGEVFSVMKSLLHRWHVSLVSYLEHPMRCTMRTLSPLQRVALLRSILKAVRDAILQTLDIFPDQRNEFIQEVRAADAAGPLLTILASVI